MDLIQIHILSCVLYTYSTLSAFIYLTCGNGDQMNSNRMARERFQILVQLYTTELSMVLNFRRMFISLGEFFFLSLSPSEFVGAIFFWKWNLVETLDLVLEKSSVWRLLHLLSSNGIPIRYVLVFLSIFGERKKSIEIYLWRACEQKFFFAKYQTHQTSTKKWDERKKATETKKKNTWEKEE